MGERMTALKFEDQDISNLDDYATLAEQFIQSRRAIFSFAPTSLVNKNWNSTE